MSDVQSPAPVEETPAPSYPDQSWQGQLAMRRAAASVPLEQRPEPIGAEVFGDKSAPVANIDAIAEAVAERLAAAMERRISANSANGGPTGPQAA